MSDSLNLQSDVIVVGSGPGGASVARQLAQKGKKVLLVDLDPQGQCATILGLKPEPGAFNLLVAEEPPNRVVRLTDHPDLYVILGDKKPGTAQTVLSIQRSPVSFTASKLKPAAHADNLDYIVVDTSYLKMTFISINFYSWDFGSRLKNLFGCELQG